MVNEYWLVRFPLSHARFLPRGLSDHSPICITSGTVSERLKKPFQVFSHIIEHPQFLTTVGSAWECSIRGDPWFVLTSKLKRVKDKLKLLNQNFGNLHLKVAAARSSLNLFQSQMPFVPSEAMQLEEASLCSSLSNALKDEELLLKQKSRIHWLSVGDSNNGFFFKSCTNRWNSNKIVSLSDENGNIAQSHRDIANMAVDFFSSKLGSPNNSSALDADVPLPWLSDEQRHLLEADFSPQDIHKTFLSMSKGKSPGPDGFSPEFYTAAWSIVGTDVTLAILYYFQSLHMPRIINSTSISLVPKSAGASALNQFRPISCCNTLYKCISKLLASRLKQVLPSLISPNQSAFVKNRSIGDNLKLSVLVTTGTTVLPGAP